MLAPAQTAEATPPMRSFATLACAVALVTGACAPPAVTLDQASLDADAVQVFVGGRVIVGDGSVIDEATLVVRDDLILEVGPAGEVERPAGAAVIDLAGQTVMPALVNAHAHLGWEGTRGGVLTALPATT